MEKHKQLTVTQLRTFKGFENISDEEAEHTIASLETLALMFYELYQKYQDNLEQFHKDTKMVKLKGSKNEEFKDAA